MRVTKKQIIAVLLMVGLVVGLFPAAGNVVPAEAAASTVSLDKLGNKGSITIGSKTKSGDWWKMELGDSNAFCMNLGYTCHSGDKYTSSSDTYYSTDSGKRGLLACIGFWYDEVKNESNKAFVYAQALVWAVQEGESSENKLKEIIRQVRSNTGYYDSKSVTELYSDIFEPANTVETKVTLWKPTGSGYRQELLVMKSKVKEEPKPSSMNQDFYLYQEIDIVKKDEAGNPLPGVQFQLTAEDIDTLYYYSVNGGAEKEFDSPTINGVTDSEGKVAFKLKYRIQTKTYHYLMQAESMSAADIKQQKEEWDEQGYLYGKNLTHDEAYELMTKDLEAKYAAIANQHTVKEISTGNANLVVSPVYAKGVDITLKRENTWAADADSAGDAVRKPYTVNVVNNFKKISVKVNKTDSSSADKKAHGEATLEGAQFKLYADSACTKAATVYHADGTAKTAGTYTIKNGTFTTDYLKAGSIYYLKEVKAPSGYCLNNKVTAITVQGSDYADKEYILNGKTWEVTNEPVKMSVDIHKFYSEGKTGALEPEKGAVFQIYLKDNGNYSACSDYDRDTITTDETGFAESKELYKGVYTVHQVSTGDVDTEKVADFDIEVGKNGESDNHKKLTYNLNNNIFKAYLRIVKKDGHTKKTVLKPGTTYQIYRVSDGKETLVTQSYSNGSQMAAADRFVSDETGQIMTYQALKSGTYKIYEIDTATGYHISTPSIMVEINSQKDNYTTETDSDGTTYSVIELEYTNLETAGELSILKKGEKLTGFSKGEFTYEETTLKGVTFEIYAAEDIETQDNQKTNWFDKGDLVGTVVTGEGAAFESDCNGITGFTMDKNGTITVNLPLGKYSVKEKKTLYGYLLPEKEWCVEFTWDNKDETVVLNATDATDETGILTAWNERAKARLNLAKTDSVSKEVISGATFGIYTRDDIFNAAGDKIVSAGDKLGTMTTDENGEALSSLDLPLMSEGYPEAVSAAAVTASGAAVTGSAVTLNSGDYYIKEELVNSSYYLDDDTEIPLHFEYKDDKTAVIEKKVEHTNQQTAVEIDKTSVTGSEEIPGCQLQIADTAGNIMVSWTSGDKDSVKLTNKDLGICNLKASMTSAGHLVIGGLKHDTEYVLTEIRPADGYATADRILFQLQESTVEKGRTVVSVKNEAGVYALRDSNVVKMVDETTKVDISKTDIAGSEEIPGCELEVKEKDTGKVIEAWTSTNEKHRIEQKLVAGRTYVLTETRPADGYVTADAIEFTVKDTGEVQGVHMADDTTKIRLIKLAKDSGQGLPGAKFEVYDSQNQKVMSFTSKEEGFDITGKLKVGETYTFKEIEAPEGYKLAGAVKYTVKDTGEIQKVSITDEKIPAPKVPQTGGMTTTVLAALIFAAVAGTLTLVIRSRKKVKTNEK